MDFKVFFSSDALIDLGRIVAYIALDDVVDAERMGNQPARYGAFLNNFPRARSHGS